MELCEKACPPSFADDWHINLKRPQQKLPLLHWDGFFNMGILMSSWKTLCYSSHTISMKKVLHILIQTLPILFMVALIPVVKNDYVLAVAYIATSLCGMVIYYKKRDVLAYTCGFFIMILSEYFFVSTGVETFARQTLLGVMPLWLPFLWAYSFVVIKRSLLILES